MIKILFVCHGNICRSPMAEFLFRDYVDKKGLGDLFFVASAATSSEEIGNSVHYGTRKILNSLGIDCSKKRAQKIKIEDYNEYDYIIGMDEYNIKNMLRVFNDKDKKIHLLLEYAGISRGISDPWYTGNFNDTYNDIIIGIEGLVEKILKS